MTALQVYESNHHVEEQKFFSIDQIELIKNTVCKGASDDEFSFFLQVAKRTGLDPFTRQIYSVPRGNQRTIQVGIDGLRLIADRTGKYIPGKEPTYIYDKNGAILSATAYVKKQARDGSWHEISATAFWAEYNAGQGLWKKMPHLMLAKCAESLALRKAFPGEMSGLYSEDEMQQADAKPQTQVVSNTYQMTGNSVQLISKDQAKELSDLHNKCQPEYKSSVIDMMKSKKHMGWSELPASLYEEVKKNALEHLEYQTMTIEEEMANLGDGNENN